MVRQDFEGKKLYKKAWYVIETKPREEHKVAQRLKLQKIQVFLPSIEMESLVFGRSTCQIKPLFPNYLFANFIFPESGETIKWSSGVKKILCFDDVPIAVDEAVIVFLRDRLNKKGVFEYRKHFKPGEAVRITRGPLKDLEGVFIREISGRDRVQILLRMLEFSHKVELHSNCVGMV